MKELSDFSLHIENFLKKIQKNSYRIFEISENIQKDWAVFKDELSLIENKLHETDRIFDEVVFNINRIFEDIFFISRNVEIKAYHLGEEGKGLEVVAQELSKLTSRAKGYSR